KVNFESVRERRPQTASVRSHPWGLTPSGLTPEQLMKGLILAQNERWRRGSGMQVERIPPGQLGGGSGERGSKAWVTCPGLRDSPSNEGVIPDAVSGGPPPATKVTTVRAGLTWY